MSRTPEPVRREHGPQGYPGLLRDTVARQNITPIGPWLTEFRTGRAGRRCGRDVPAVIEAARALTG